MSIHFRPEDDDLRWDGSGNSPLWEGVELANASNRLHSDKHLNHDTIDVFEAKVVERFFKSFRHFGVIRSPQFGLSFRILHLELSTVTKISDRGVLHSLIALPSSTSFP